jgi:hypothetical protein
MLAEKKEKGPNHIAAKPPKAAPPTPFVAFQAEGKAAENIAFK